MYLIFDKYDRTVGVMLVIAYQNLYTGAAVKMLDLKGEEGPELSDVMIAAVLLCCHLSAVEGVTVLCRSVMAVGVGAGLEGTGRSNAC